MKVVGSKVGIVPVAALCFALGVARASFYRAEKRKVSPRQPKVRPPSHRALDQTKRAEILEILHSERFVDRAPAEIVNTLIEEDERYPCSESTMYRILRENKEVRERRNQLRHPSYAKPELLATGPNQVWSWDITKLKGPEKWVYYYLFVMLDIFSRYVVAWMVAERENATLAKRLIKEACEKQAVEPESLTIHNDRGPPMKAKTTGQLIASLGVEQSFGRPHVSNDNPFSESQFKTCKYHPGFPERFGSITDALEYCRRFFPWYNDDHRHSSLVYLTPRQVHYGLAQQALDKRHKVMLAAYHEHPERFVRGPPKRATLPKEVWINRPKSPNTAAEDAGIPITPCGEEPAVVESQIAQGGSPFHRSDKSQGAWGTESTNSTAGEADPGGCTAPSGAAAASPDGNRHPRPQGAQVASQQRLTLPRGGVVDILPEHIQQEESPPDGKSSGDTENRTQ